MTAGLDEDPPPASPFSTSYGRGSGCPGVGESFLPVELRHSCTLNRVRRGERQCRINAGFECGTLKKLPTLPVTGGYMGLLEAAYGA